MSFRINSTHEYVKNRFTKNAAEKPVQKFSFLDDEDDEHDSHSMTQARPVPKKMDKGHAIRTTSSARADYY